MTDHLVGILSRLTEAAGAQATVLAGIDGLGGAGKTTLASTIAHSAGGAEVVMKLGTRFAHSMDSKPANVRPSGADARPGAGKSGWLGLVLLAVFCRFSAPRNR